ncbi:hypothetical protein PV327_009969 [Microctonus hyperodae]|uniref:Uncharacterized protein n=1 Tax=Microctonus hyperodae TaxID=165561 RepID=A0AA39F228_MICHY|nr:hypothetical protein PV327_009969 [Microctonus hyperodae]
MDNFYELKSSMLMGSEVIVKNICEKSKELNVYNEKLLIEQDKLKRVNIFAHRQRMPHLPKIKVTRTAGYLFLKVIFDYSLPQNSMIFVNLTSGNQCQFTSKLIDDKETTVEMQLLPEILENTVDLTLDLLTFGEENQPWCIIRNCIKKPTLRDRTNIRKSLNDKRNFLLAKLNVLRSIMEDDKNIDMKKVKNIKKSIRKDIVDL